MIEEKITQDLQTLLEMRPVAVRFETTALPVSRQLEREVRKKLAAEVGSDPSFFRTSVSHTRFKGETTTIVVGSDQCLGVDLESTTREVHPRLLSRIASAAERKLGMSALEFWIAKEAAFKSNPENRNTVLSQYRVREWDAGQQAGIMGLPANSSVSVNGAICKFKLVKLSPWWIALAYTYKIDQG